MEFILNAENRELLISLNSPYTNVKRIISYEDVLEYSHSIYVDLDRYFRYSYNNINYSNWLELSNSNLQFIEVPYGNDFWIEYKYELNEIEEGESIVFKSIALEILNNREKIIKKQCDIKNQDCCSSEGDSIVSPYCDTNIFNPYDLEKSINIYEPIVKLTSDMFGFDVNYYKTNPNLNSKDVILNEYSLYNFEKECIVKVLIPDNVIPTKELQFNSQDGISLPEMFEVHIVKSEFENAFGVGSVPRVEDVLYFEYLKRIFMINSVMIADENPFNSATYYRVNLTDYAKKANVLDEEGIIDNIKDLADSHDDIFGKEVEDEIERVVKPQQYETVAKEKDGSDIIRQYIDPLILIKEHSLINENTYQVISKFYYDFSNYTENKAVITYNYSEILPNSFSISYLIRPKKTLTIESTNIHIKKILETSTYSEDYYSYGGSIIETVENHDLVDGDVFYIKNSSYYNGINIVAKVLDNNKFIINAQFKGFNGGIISKKYESELLMRDGNNFSIILINGNTLFLLDQNLYSFAISNSIGKWNYNIFNVSNDFKQIGFYLRDEKINLIKSETKLIDSFTFENSNISLNSGSYFITNIRIFNTKIELEQQTSVLSQNIVMDDHLSLIIDNAQPQIRLKKYEKSR